MLNTPWGAQSDWSTQSLLVTFHREAAGGEKFFQILDRVSGEPQRYRALLELLYVCLALGFEGKYRLDTGAPRVSRKSAKRSTAASKACAKAWNPSCRRAGKASKTGATPCCASYRCGSLPRPARCCCSAPILYFDAKLGSAAEPVSAELARVGLESFDAPPAATAAPDKRPARAACARRSRAAESTSKSPASARLITLTVPDLFTSGSASDQRALREDLVREVGAALDQRARSRRS